MIKYLIFDFDGVILDTNKIKTNAFVSLYSNYSLKIQKKVKEHHIQNGGMSRYDKFEYYHKKFLNKDITNKEINDLSIVFSNLILDKIYKSKFIPGAIEFIKKNRNNHKFFIVSATPEVELINICKKKKIDQYFISIFGSPRKKTQNINLILEEKRIGKNNCIYIGDSYNDLVAARDSNVKFVGFGDNFNDNKFKSILRFSEFKNINNILNA